MHIVYYTLTLVVLMVLTSIDVKAQEATSTANRILNSYIQNEIFNADSVNSIKRILTMLTSKDELTKAEFQLQKSSLYLISNINKRNKVEGDLERFQQQLIIFHVLRSRVLGAKDVVPRKG